MGQGPWPRRFRRLLFLGFALACALTAFVAWIARGVVVVTALPKNLVVVAAPEAAHLLEPLLEKRRREGFQVAVVTPKAVAAGRPPLPFADGYALLVGNPFVPATSPYHLPTSTALERRTYTRRAVGTGFPVGPILMARSSDRVWVGQHLGQFACGRFPAGSASELERMVARTLAYDEAFRAHRARRLLVMSESTGFSALIDGTLELLQAALLFLGLPRGLSADLMHSSGHGPARSAAVVASLDRGPDLAVFTGHGAPTCLGSMLDVDDLRTGAPKELSGPLLIWACTTGFQARGDISEILASGKSGPSHVLFASGFTHPYPDALFGMAILGAIRANTPMTAAELVESAVHAARAAPRLTWAADPLAWALAGLTAEDLKGMTDDIGVLQSLYGDPTQTVYLGR